MADIPTLLENCLDTITVSIEKHKSLDCLPEELCIILFEVGNANCQHGGTCFGLDVLSYNVRGYLAMHGYGKGQMHVLVLYCMLAA